MTPDLHRAVIVIELDVEEAFAVGGPHHRAVGLLERDGVLVICPEIADDDGGQCIGALQPHQMTRIELDVDDIDARAVQD